MDHASTMTGEVKATSLQPSSFLLLVRCLATGSLLLVSSLPVKDPDIGCKELHQKEPQLTQRPAESGRSLRQPG